MTMPSQRPLFMAGFAFLAGVVILIKVLVPLAIGTFEQLAGLTKERRKR